MLTALIIYIVLGILVWTFLTFWLDSLDGPESVKTNIVASLIVILLWPLFVAGNLGVVAKNRYRRGGR